MMKKNPLTRESSWKLLVALTLALIRSWSKLWLILNCFNVNIYILPPLYMRNDGRSAQERKYWRRNIPLKSSLSEISFSVGFGVSVKKNLMIENKNIRNRSLESSPHDHRQNKKKIEWLIQLCFFLKLFNDLRHIWHK